MDGRPFQTARCGDLALPCLKTNHTQWVGVMSDGQVTGNLSTPGGHRAQALLLQVAAYMGTAHPWGQVQ